jgi:hypothetical protein
MISLQELSKAALARDASRPCIEFERRWISWGEIRHVAERMGAPGEFTDESHGASAFEERYGIPILLSYGATEFAGPASATTPELHAEWGKRKFGGAPVV